MLLDLGAGWCHWCHVMDEQTYENAAVIGLIESKFVAIRADQDARPDLSARYQDYGWPATIVFDENGRELAKRAGYIPPERMISMLQAFVDDPTPGPSIAAQAPLQASTVTVLPAALRGRLLTHYLEHYDAAHASWGGPLKFLDWDGVEWALVGAGNGDAQYEKMARDTLLAQRALLDPVWGGVYQYSAEGDWKAPHFEKIMMMQAQNLRVYSLAYAQTKDPLYLAAASSIARYLRDFLTSPQGEFYASQDADLVPGQHSAAYFASDDAARRKQGIPRVDKSVYARENGWAIRALAAFAAATGDEAPLDAARKAAEAILRSRAIAGGGFRHGEKDEAGPYLGDTLAMGQAFLALHEATGDRSWLKRASDCARFISEHFTPAGAGEAGFIAAAAERTGASSVRDRDENISVARFANLLYRYTGDAKFMMMRDQAMRFLLIPAVADRFQPAGVLLADFESARAPLHVTVVGGRKDAAAKALFREALRSPGAYRRIEWWDPAEGPAPNPDTRYPASARPALYSCTANRCGPPVREAQKVRGALDGLTQAEAEALPWKVR